MAAPVTAPLATRPFDESLLRGKEYLLETPVFSEFPVQDAVLGPLGKDQSLRKFIDKFFQEAAKGSFDSGSVEPRWEAYLKNGMQRARADGLLGPKVRVGEALPESQGGRMVPFRMSGGLKESSGWIFLTDHKGTYLVSDIQIVAIEPPATIDPEGELQEFSTPLLR